MKYLIVTEGEKYKIADNEKQKNQYLENYAEKEKARGVEKTDVWLNEMLTLGCSRIYNYFGDLVIPFEDKKDFEKIRELC